MKSITYKEGLITEVENPAGKQGFDVLVLELTKWNATRLYCSLKPGEELKAAELLFGKYKAVAVDMRRRTSSFSGSFKTSDNSPVTIKTNIVYHVIDSHKIAIEFEDPLRVLQDTVQAAIAKEISRYGKGNLEPSFIENIASDISVSNLGFSLDEILFLEFDKGVGREVQKGDYQLALAPKIKSAIDKPISINEWWQNILKEHGNYSCYCLFLVLPSDKEAIRYLTEYSNELRIISGTNTLILALGSNQHLRSDVKGEIWSSAIEGDISQGHSAIVASSFDIDFTEFPCLVVFKNLNSSEQISIILKGMSADEIADKMRAIFSVIHKAVNEKKSPLNAIQRQRNSEHLKNSGKSFISELRNVTGKTFQAAMEAWINAKIK